MRDSTFVLKDAGLVAADAAGTVDAAAKIADLGAGKMEGHMVVDVTAINIDDDDELYQISLQGSNESDFASDIVDLAMLEVGANEALGGDVDSLIGRYTMPFSNEQNSIVYQYVRVYCDVTGTVTPGINYTARLEK